MKKLLFRSISSALFLIFPFSSHALDQWASKVINFSSQYSSTSWSANQVLKAQNVSSYGDDANAWAPSVEDSGEEFITVGFTTPVYAEGVTIRETDGYGFVTSIDVIDTNNKTYTIWTGNDTSTPDQINDFKVNWPRTTYLVKAVTIHINTAIHNDWEEIDAIQLSGSESLNGSITPRLEHTANLVCMNTTTNQTINTTIKGGGKTAIVTHWDCEQAGLKLNIGDTVSIQITGKITN